MSPDVECLCHSRESGNDRRVFSNQPAPDLRLNSSQPARGTGKRSFSARHFLATAADGPADDGATTMGKASQATLGPGGHWRNWVGNQSFIARHKAEPASEDELSALLRAASNENLPV